MSWVSVTKLKTVCEAIKNYVISQCDDVYNKIETAVGNSYVKKTGDTMTGNLYVPKLAIKNSVNAYIQMFMNNVVVAAQYFSISIDAHTLSMYLTTDEDKIRTRFAPTIANNSCTVRVSNKAEELGHFQNACLMTLDNDIVTVKYVANNAVLNKSEITDDELAKLTNLFS